MSSQRLSKTYSDHNYLYTTMVRHNGTVVAFAVDDQRCIYYSVLDLDSVSSDKGELEANYWNDNPSVLHFPSEISEVGFAVARPTKMPVVKAGSRIEAQDELSPEEINPFLSTTARLTALAPIQVVSDGKHIFVFRQAIDAQHPDALFQLGNGNGSGDPARVDYVLDVVGSKVPIVDRTLLCDRFVLAGNQLKPSMEVRFRRSRHKTEPESAKDTLGTEDMDGNRFYEPTQELSFVRNLDAGRFAVTLLPTQISELRRWQIFAVNRKTDRIDSFNVEQGSDGLLNTQGSMLYTSPDPQYRSAVLERSPGKCPFTGADLVPLLPESDYAETALSFDGNNDYVEIPGAAAALAFTNRTYTIEAWIKPRVLGREMAFVSKFNHGVNGCYVLALRADGRLWFCHDVNPYDMNSTLTVGTDAFHHVAVTYDGKTVRFYVDTQPAGSVNFDYRPETSLPLMLGAAPVRGVPDKFFDGQIDEVRLWNRVRSEDELRRDHGFRLVGNEPGLCAYYRFDEGSGNQLYDQTDNALHGTLKNGPKWVTSDAPIGERPSLRRDSFRIYGRTIETGMSALLYYQQEKDQNAGSGDPMKRQARVMLACGTSGPDLDGGPTTRNYIAMLDIAVARDGRLAQVPDEIGLPQLAPPSGVVTLDDMSAAEQALKAAEARVQTIQNDIVALQNEIQRLNNDIANAANDITKNWYRIKIHTHYIVPASATIDGAMLGAAPSYAGIDTLCQWQFVPSSNGGYTLRNRASGQSICSGADSLVTKRVSDGSSFQLRQTNGFQVLHVEYIPSLPTGLGFSVFIDFGVLACKVQRDVWVTGAAAISSFERVGLCVDLEQQLVAKTAQLATQKSALDGAILDRNTKAAQLAVMTKGLRGNEVTLPMGTIYLDRCGLPIAGALLGFAWSDHAPALLDSTTGQVILYYRGQDRGQIFSAYYDPTVSRQVMQLGSPDKGLQLLCTSAGVNLGDVRICVSDSTAPDLCTLVISSSTAQETWTNVPRSPRRLAAILSGDVTSEFVAVAGAAKGNIVPLASPSVRTLSSGDRVQIGTELCVMASDAAPGSNFLALTKGPSTVNQPGMTVRYLPYDFSQAISNRAGTTLDHGSLMFRPVPTLSDDPLPNGDALRLQFASFGRWHGDAPGRSFSFDGASTYLSSINPDSEPLAMASDATLETWLKPDVVSGNVRVLTAATRPGPVPQPGSLAFAFDGKTALRLGNRIALGKNNFTIELWLRRTQTNLGTYEVILTHGNTWAPSQRLNVCFVADNRFRIGFYNDLLAAPNATTDTNWHHYAFSHDAATCEVVLYIDGNAVTRFRRTEPYAGMGDTILGVDNLSTFESPSLSEVAELRIFGRVRTEQEIKLDLKRRLTGSEPGLLGYWNFQSKQLADLSGAGNHGVIAGTPKWVPGPVPVTGLLAADAPPQAALAFDGSSYVHCGNTLALARTSFTIELWVRRTRTGVAECVLVHGPEESSGINSKLALSFVSQDNLVMGFWGEDLWDPVPIADSKWHHFAFCHNAQTLEVILYRDGQEVARKKRSAPYAGTGMLLLGMENTTRKASPCTCEIDELRVWNYVRSPSDIVGSLRAGLAGTESGLLAYYNFTSYQFSDRTGRGNNGTLFGKAQWAMSPLPEPRVLAPIAYTLGLTEAAQDSAFAFDGSTHVKCGSQTVLNKSDFSIELWVRRTVINSNDFFFSLGDETAVGRKLVIGFRSSNVMTFSFWGADLDTTTTFTDMDWHHWAFTYNRTTGQRIIYRDGEKVLQDTASRSFEGVGELVIGAYLDGGNVASASKVELDEVRVFGFVRSQRDIQLDLRRRLTGTETGLLAYWTFLNRQAHDYTGSGKDGSILGNIKIVSSPINKSYKVFAGIGGEYIRSREAFSLREWRHVAFAFRQAWGVKLPGSAYLEIAHADGLNLCGDMTLEVHVKLDRVGIFQPLVVKGRFADGTGQSVPYCLAVRDSGQLLFAFETAGCVQKAVVSMQTLKGGQFYRLAVVRRAASAQSEKKGTKTIGDQTIEIIESVEVKKWQDIALFIDGVQVPVMYEGTAGFNASVKSEDAPPIGHDGPLLIGRHPAGTATWLMQGELAEVRLWNKARDASQIGRGITTQDNGLVARWRFPENKGNVTLDDTQSYPARLRGTKWIRTPDPQGSQAWLYINGVSVAIDRLSPADDLLKNVQTAVGLTLGGRLNDRNQLSESYGGEIEETRIWRTVRSEEQILDNLFTRLKGEKPDLIAYYTYDLDSTRPDSQLLYDNGLRGNHLKLAVDTGRPAIILSTAPVSNDTADVRSALAGVKNPFHGSISAAPSVSEYGDLQRDTSGGMHGVMKRCYAFLRNGVWTLNTGYKIGNLITEWVSQAQFAPQVIGFIEGAPPIPSENVTLGVIEDNGETPRGVSKVEFIQADDVNITTGSSYDTSMHGAFGLKASVEANADTLLITAPLGIGSAVPAVNFKLDTAIGVNAEFSGGWTSESSESNSRAVSKDMSVSATGYWEAPTSQKAPDMGRRFIPKNVGFALVQSETADVYAMRLEHNRALVGYRMTPNLDIPKDWNLISFPINPRYTKQGTIDGCIGFSPTGKVLDSDYPMAAQYGEYSYFKPREAYSLKRRILQEEQQELSYYNSFVVGDLRPSAMSEVSDRAGKALKGVVGELPSSPSAGSGAAAQTLAKRDLCNTYVWTAAGGFFAETTETTDVVSESTSGNFSFDVSVSAELAFDIKVFGVGVGMQLDASFGGGQTLTRQKSREATRSFNLNVEMDLPSSLQKYTPGPNGLTAEFDANGQPVLCPGKVDAYRFMTFYLDTDRRNFQDLFGKVVDPLWLEQSQEPNAIAMRQARQENKQPPCWRILHRVTFVSRLLPPVPPPTAPPLEKAMRTQNVASNYELIRRLEPYVRDSIDSLSRLADATRQALKVYLPELVPHTDQITKYLALYYGVTE